MEEQLRAGIAIYNAGATHAAHDAWEEVWLDLPTGSDDERLLHGLIQFTAAIYHAQNRNWSGTVGLAESGREYLIQLPSTYRGVDIEALRNYLQALKKDPERIERASPPVLTYKGQPLAAADLELGAITTAAEVLAEEFDQYDEAVVEDAIEYAREEADSSQTEFISLLTTFVDESTHRGIVYNRLESQVERRRRKERDVAGLFDPADETEES
jgi:predicted metal-dependent hydrolase